MIATIKTAALAAALGCGLASAAAAATVTPTGPDSIDVMLTAFELNSTVYTATLSTTTSVSFDIDTAGMNVLAVVTGVEADGDAFYVVENLASTSYSYVLEAGTYSVSLSNFGAAGTFAVSNIEVSAVPVPASLPLLVGALGVVGLVKRRRKAA
ncbi:MAG: VPLPA-CTERM sorting domain-containing protein [Sphingomonadales bacterium]|nr:VPLPA-CTERM sorting domain-containing protein [Sphingomonadales bacterium]